MTRKDFVLIADAIKQQVIDYTFQGEWEMRAGALATASALADALARTNDRFDRERFMIACGRDYVARPVTT